MPLLSRVVNMLGALGMLSAVALGAFATHGLRARLPPEALSIFRTGIEYHFYHAIGLFVVGQLAASAPDSRLLQWAGALMAAGIVLFSGALYALALSGERWWGAVPPFGGIAWLAAWLMIAIAMWRGRARGDASEPL
jgi:uncharacterized membrane protein YgdD (TMEM256/DUF423 family)